MKPLLVLALISLIPAWSHSEEWGTQLPNKQSFLSLDHLSGVFDIPQNELVPLSVASDRNFFIISFFKGYLVLNSSWEMVPQTLLFLRKNESGLREGTPWMFSPGPGMFLALDGSTHLIRIFYSRVGVMASREVTLNSITHAYFWKDKFTFVDSRKVFELPNWEQDPQETTPMPFFPKEFQVGSDDTLWAMDALTQRVWKHEEGFFTPWPSFKELPSRPLALGGRGDVCFLAGNQWLGAWNKKGQRLWLLEKDYQDRPLPPDPRMKMTPEGIVIFSSLDKTVRLFSWGEPLQSEGRDWQPPSPGVLIENFKKAINEAQNQFLIKECEGVLALGVEFLKKILKDDPFQEDWKVLRIQWQQDRERMRDYLVGFGTFNLEFPKGESTGLASWNFQPDDGTSQKDYEVFSQLWVNGQPSVPFTGKIPGKKSMAPWPGFKVQKTSGFNPPSFLNGLIYSEKGSLGTWFRHFLGLKTIEK